MSEKKPRCVLCMEPIHMMCQKNTGYCSQICQVLDTRHKEQG